MGKTHRKSRHFAGKTRQHYVEDEVRRDYARFIRTGDETVRLAGSERKALHDACMETYRAEMAEYRKALCVYEARLASFVKRYGGHLDNHYTMARLLRQHDLYEPRRPYRPQVPKWTRVVFEGQSFAEYFSQNAKDYEDIYDREHRDGGSERYRHYETVRGTMTQKERRADDRRLLRIIAKDAEAWDDAAFMSGKEQFWDYWW